MQKTSPSKSLKDSILRLERRQKKQELFLTEQFHATFYDFNTGKILLNLVANLISPSELKSNIIHSVSEWVGQYFSPSQEQEPGKSKNPILQITSLLLKKSASNFIAENSETIRILGLYYFRKLKEKYFTH